MDKWVNFFMTVVDASAKLSRDPKTKVGAVIVKNKRIKSTGFNGAPSNFPDDKVPWICTDSDQLIDQKNTYMCHAELNAVLNYDGQISDLRDSDIYVSVSPCHHCACMLAQVGIKRVIYKEKYHRKDETDAAERILALSNIEYKCIDELEDNNEG